MNNKHIIEEFLSDYYRYIGSIPIGSFCKYDLIEDDNFISLINNNVPVGLEFEAYISNEYLILRYKNIEYLFKYDTELNFSRLEKVGSKYRLWIASETSEDGQEDYYADVIIKDKKIRLEYDHLIESLTSNFRDLSVEIFMQLEIYRSKLNDISYLELDNFIESNQAINKYQL